FIIPDVVDGSNPPALTYRLNPKKSYFLLLIGLAIHRPIAARLSRRRFRPTTTNKMIGGSGDEYRIE
ncbi:hypothetical protein DERF_002891, partial [Dermatophagoides farinae]